MTVATSEPVVLEARIAIVSVMHLPANLAVAARVPNTDPPQRPVDFDVRRHAWDDALATARAGETLPTKPSLPWRFEDDHAAHDGFWEHYLGGADLDRVDAVTAWRGVVPIREPAPQTVKSTDDHWAAAASLERFRYPAAVASIATVRVKTRWNLDGASALVRFVNEAHWRRASQDVGTLGGLIDLALTELGQDSAHLSGLGSHQDPDLVVAAIIRAKSVTETAPAQGDAVHRMLESLCRLEPVSKARVLAPIAERTTPIGLQDAGTILYGTRRGRALWMPVALGGGGQRIGTYQRSLVSASMQTAALLGVVRSAAAVKEGGHELSVDGEGLVRNAATALGRLYAGDDSTYRTGSIFRQIQDSGLVPVVDALRQRYALGPTLVSALAPTPPAPG